MHFHQGNSGSTLKLVTDSDGQIYVTKTFTGDIKRALRSIEAQQAFPNIDGLVSVPVQIETKRIDQLVVRMPFIRGVCGENFYLDLGVDDWSQVFKTINNYFNILILNCVQRELDMHALNQKLGSISVFVGRIEHAEMRKVAMECLDIAYDYAPSLRGVSLPHGPIHGDLTLSNVIFSRNSKSLYIFDFLPSWSDTIYIDFAKIRQDLLYAWSLRFAGGAAHLRHKCLLQPAKASLPFVMENNKLNLFFDLINMLRIVPYANDEKTYEWLLKNMRKVTK